MFIARWSSFHSIVACLFVSILMPKSLMQECYKMLAPVTYRFMRICHFCHIWWVLHMNMSSRCVLIYAMPYLQGCLPCIFVINVVTSTSMQSRLRDIADSRDLGFWSPCSVVIFMPCKHDATVRSMIVLSTFIKDDLEIWLCSIHTCPCLQLWSALACLNLALLLL